MSQEVLDQAEWELLHPERCLGEVSDTDRALLYRPGLGNISVPIEVLKIIPSIQVCIDGNRIDEYVPDGSQKRPFKTVSSALATMSGPTTVMMAPAIYTETVALTVPNYPLTVYGNGATLNLLSATIVANYTAYDLNIAATADIQFAGATGVERFILRNGSRKGSVNLTSGTLDLQACTQTWNTTSDVLTVSGTGLLLEIGCINTLPVNQTSATSQVLIENSIWNTSRANTYLLNSTAGQFTIVNSIVQNSSVTAGGGIRIANSQTSSTPNVISGCMVAAVNAISITSGITLYSKVSPVGDVVVVTIVGVPDLKMFTQEPFTPITAGLTISTATPDNLILGASYAVNLGTAFVAKKISIASSSTYTLVIPTGVVMYYNGVPYTAVTKTVPLGYLMSLAQVTASIWMLQGNATLS
jgi:hypothetical protein